MPVGNIRKLRPVHQFLKSDSNDNIILDQYGVVQNVTEDFDDNDVVDTKHLIPTHILKFDSISDRNDSGSVDSNGDLNNTDAVSWLKGDISVVEGGSTKRGETGTYIYIGTAQDTPSSTSISDWLLLTSVGEFNILEFISISLRNINTTVSWLKGDLAIVDGGLVDRDDTGTYIYVGTDQDTPAITDNDDWKILTSVGEFSLSNQLETWIPSKDYPARSQIVYNKNLYTADSPIEGNSSAPGQNSEWIEGVADSLQGVKADGSVQKINLPTEHTRDGDFFGVKFEPDTLIADDGTVVTLDKYKATIRTTLLEKLLDRPPFATDINNNQSNVLTGNPKQIFLKFNPNPPANAGYKSSTISYADLEESPAVFKFVFETTAARNANLDFLGEADEDGNKVAYPEGTLDEDKDGTIDIIWVTGDQVIVSEDTFNNDVLLSSKGAYVYVGDTQSTAVLTVDDDWQFVGINTLAETAVQSITVGDATEALPEPNGNVTIPADQIKTAYESNAETNALTDAEKAKILSLPTLFPTVDVDNTSKEYILKVTDVDGADTATWIEEHSVTKINELSDVNVGVDSGTNPGSAGDGLVMKWNNTSTNWVPAGTGGEPWNTNVSYSSGDIATFNSKVYVANTTTTAGTNPVTPAGLDPLTAVVQWDEIVSSPTWVPTADPSYLDSDDVTVTETSIEVGGNTFTPETDVTLKYNVLLTAGFLFEEETTPTDGRTPYKGKLIDTDTDETRYYFQSSDDSWYAAASGGTKLIGF